MFPRPTPLPSEAVYATVKFHVFSLVGRGLAEEVGASRSTITNVSGCDNAMSTVRGSAAKLSVPYEITTSVRLSVARLDCWYTRSVTRSHCSNPVEETKFHTGTPWSCTRTFAFVTGVKPSGQRMSRPRKFFTVRFAAISTRTLEPLNGVLIVVPSASLSTQISRSPVPWIVPFSIVSWVVIVGLPMTYTPLPWEPCTGGPAPGAPPSTELTVSQPDQPERTRAAASPVPSPPRPPPVPPRASPPAPAWKAERQFPHVSHAEQHSVIPEAAPPFP